jgi:hypothetical protein
MFLRRVLKPVIRALSALGGVLSGHQPDRHAPPVCEPPPGHPERLPAQPPSAIERAIWRQLGD